MEHPRLVRGTLRNGLRYAILPNDHPSGRFEAHLELNVGSCEEGDDEQGLAHLVEHVTFMGSRKRERLFSTGSKSNAYTDFHHTVYHFHCPTADQSGRRLMPVALEALREIAFEPELLAFRIEKERKAILSELQMINTIDYRCSTMHLRELHSETPLACRFPIGRADQIAQWDATRVRAFHATHYHPDVADLYIVGDVDPAQTERLIADAFRSVRSRPRSLAALRRADRRVKPHVRHAWTQPPRAAAPAGEHPWPKVFKHDLLQSFSLTLFAKEPVRRRTEVKDMAAFLADRIIACCLARRLNKVERPNPPFIGVEFDCSDAPSEGCAVSTFIVYADAAPGRWQQAVENALRELHHVFRRGLSAAEVQAMKGAILADSRLRAQQAAGGSADQLALLMECDGLGHTFTDAAHHDAALHAAAEAIGLDALNDRARELLEHIVRYGDEDAPRAAACVVCMPSLGADGTTGDAGLEDEVVALLRKRWPADDEGPAGDVITPDRLVAEEELAARRRRLRPRFVAESVVDLAADAPPGAKGGAANPDGMGRAAPEPVLPSDLRLRRLNNGVAVTSARTRAEADAVAVRVSVPGGRSAEDPSRPGELALATATMLQGGCVAGFSREQVEMFCITHLIDLNMEVTEDCVQWDMHFPVGHDGRGLRAALELLHALLTNFSWEEDALETTRALLAAQHDARAKSLEQAALGALMEGFWAGDPRFLDLHPERFAALDLAALERAQRRCMRPDRMEVVVVGDFDEALLDDCLLEYLGTIPPAAGRRPLGPAPAPKAPRLPARYEEPVRRMRLADSEPRAIAYITGRCVSRFGTCGGAVHDNAHPLRAAVALELLTEIINSRLFSMLRDVLGLVYESSIRFHDFELLPVNGYVVTISAAPGKVDEAHAAALRVLRDLVAGRQRITEYDLPKARRAVLSHLDVHTKDLSWWLGRLQHLQAGCLPGKDARCVKDYRAVLEGITVDDLREVVSTLEVDDGKALSVIMESAPHDATNSMASRDKPSPWES